MTDSEKLVLSMTALETDTASSAPEAAAEEPPEEQAAVLNNNDNNTNNQRSWLPIWQGPCQECRSNEPGAWSDAEGRVYCDGCWQKWFAPSENRPREPHVLDGLREAYAAEMAAGAAIRYVVPPEIPPGPGEPTLECTLTGESVLSVARRVSLLLGHDPCILFGTNMSAVGGRDGPKGKGELGELCRATTLLLALPSDKLCPVPYWGGLYAPRVVALPHGAEPGFPFAAVAMQRLLVPDEPNIASEPFRSDLRSSSTARIRAALSISLHHGHKHLVIGSWGCEHDVKVTQVVAHAYAEVLADKAVRSNIATVTFALSSEGETLRVFQGAFRDLDGRAGHSSAASEQL
ncbi:unnamed protein product [Polarella glacialis]|nr:unnamed protein product [Polarella glacialis]